MNRQQANPIAGEKNEPPRFLWFRTWRGVYAFVIGSFILYIVLLVLLSRASS